MAILIQGVRGWLEWAGADDYQLNEDLYDEEFRRLIVHQNMIVWKHVFLGRFAWDWADLQDNYYATHPGINPKK